MKPLSPRAQKALLDYRREHALPASVRARVIEQLAKQPLEPSLESSELPRTQLPGEAWRFLRLVRWAAPALGLVVGVALWLRSPPPRHVPEGSSPVLRVTTPLVATQRAAAAEPLAASPASGAAAASAPRSTSKGRGGRVARVEPSGRARAGVAAVEAGGPAREQERVPAARVAAELVAEEPESSPSQEQARLAALPAASPPSTSRASDQAAHYAASGISTRAQAKQEPPARASLDEEVMQMRTAYSHLRGGDALRALSALSEHARRFPDGKLVAMGKVARIQALCDLGKRSEASAEAAQFLAEHGDSPYAARVRQVCVARSAKD
jgi:hypothetical protein